MFSGLDNLRMLDLCFNKLGSDYCGLLRNQLGRNQDGGYVLGDCD